MHYLIYKITNTVNNKIYIGKHETTNKDDEYFGSGTLLKRAIEKYGIDKFIKEILFDYDSEEKMNDMESQIVNEEFIARLDTYNIKIGGQGGFDYVNTLPKTITQIESSKINLKLASIERNRLMKDTSSEWYKEYNQKRSNALKHYYKNNPGTFTGKLHTLESKKKIGEKNKQLVGNRNSQFGTCWVTKELENKKIKVCDIDYYRLQGWVKGRRLKMWSRGDSNSQKNGF